ncbi:MAG TPA: helix-turn-helix domain-containing protein [Mucilaginibacter sp.]|jgi:AraC-like DNA-binding protein
MPIDIILLNITCVNFFMLAFIAFLNPLRVNIIANRWFGIFLFSVGCMLLNVIIDVTKANDKYAQLIAFNELSRFALAPALYLGVLYYTSATNSFIKKQYLHFIPFAVFFICTISYVIKPHTSIFNSAWFPEILKNALQIFIVLSVRIQLPVYWALSWYRLVRHQKSIQMVASNTTPVNLNWLKYLLLGLFVMILLSYNDTLFKIQFLKTFSPMAYLSGTLFITYFLLRQKEIYPYEERELEDINLLINETKKNPVTRPRFSSEYLADLKTKVVILMEHEQLFLDNELSLPELAKKLAVSPHDLSYLLNEGFGVNFFQFVNTYRVNEAKRLMLSDKHRHLNMLGIAYSAGFNSKTTFNTAFKKETGLSPSQYIEEIKTDNSPAASFQ